MALFVTTVLCVVFASFAILCQVYLLPLLTVLGTFRTVQTFGLDAAACTRIPELQACEKIVLVRPSGLLYLACSTPESRLAWTPGMNQLNAEERSSDDYIATYDSTTSKVARLRLEDFDSDQPISVHGMDVVSSASNASELFVYMINHRAPSGQDPRKVGADSVIEVFKATVSENRLFHIKTVRDPTIVSPNDIAGLADGKGFYFTNDHGSKAVYDSMIQNPWSATTSVGYCHIDHGCEIVASGLPSSNGILKASSNDTIYVSSSFGGKITVFQKREDNSLSLMDVISIDQVLDNLSIDNEDRLWVAAFPRARDIKELLSKDLDHATPVAAFRISSNIGPSSNGEKYKVEKVLEDDGTIVSGSTSVAYDSDRNLLFMHGIVARQLTVCRI
ncbi:hypothetical protein DFJ43DRAFT_1057035 [Lentinula guzmanii]|uniref:SMP-30/Gluconolactonase/LRE-like region domain-containing protein n=1 Tax=Lentinula guzmanii TaxID=2804957 RepID=A0AA38JET3_9AGAR|nr:hypothetical protein DFJ43DRAFT_1057035 [Lentinula guzmanii]